VYEMAFIDENATAATTWYWSCRADISCNSMRIYLRFGGLTSADFQQNVPFGGSEQSQSQKGRSVFFWIKNHGRKRSFDFIILIVSEM
jgi:hypothetical protein